MSLDLDQFKGVFLEMIRNHSDNNSGIDYSELLVPEIGDDLDRLNVEKENLLKFRLKGRERHYIKKIGQALQRIEDGTFGKCEECGCDIEQGRLAARPCATMCISCKEEQERNESHILYGRRSHTWGQGLSHDNMITLPVADEEILKESKLNFEKCRLEIAQGNSGT